MARRREFARAVVAAVVIASVFAVWIIFEIGGDRATLIFDDVTLSLVTLGVVIPCAKAAAARSGRARIAWILMAASVASWSVGEMIWTWYEVVVGNEVPYPSLADVGYICSYPLAAAAIVLLPSAQSMISRVRVALDGVLIAGCLLFLSWVFALGDVFHSGHSTFAQLLAVAYLLADVALISVVLTNLQMSSRPRRSDVLLAAGLAALCMADTAFAYLTATDSYSTGALSDIGWLAAFLLIGLAAMHSRLEDHHASGSRLRDRRWALLVPTIPAAIVAALTPTADDAVLAVIGAMVFVLVVTRQAVIHRENEALASNLRTQVDEVRNREERFEYAAKATSDAIWDLDLGNDEIEWGEGLTTQFGHDRASARSLEWWQRHVHPDDRDAVTRSLDNALSRRDVSWTYEYRFEKADGTYASVIDRGYVVLDGSGAPVRMVGAMADITERHSYEAELAYRAHHDALTGLPNRVLLNDEIDRALQPGPGAPASVGVLFLDVDHFKLINDSYGHAAGDDVIVVLASRLVSAVRPGDVVSRFAGDEFVILCPNLATEPDASRVASRVLTALDAPISVHGRTLHISASIGIALGRPGDVTAADLLRLADTALYEAKAKGRARFEIFSETLRGKAEFQIDVLTDLRRAFEQGNLDVHYQPIVDLESKEPVGAEALLRWHRNDEFIPPAMFVRLAEESGLIVPLGAWVIRQACATASTWPPDMWVSVNVSPRQLSDELVEVVMTALADTGLSASRLCVEITETADLAPAHVRSVLVKLHAIGVRIAIDDFGTGHSSLTHLRELPVDAMKVDRAFVGGMTARPSDEGIVAAVIALARGIGVRVIAEGVETEEQAVALRALGCQYGQGYLFARPAPAAEFQAHLTSVS